MTLGEGTAPKAKPVTDLHVRSLPPLPSTIEHKLQEVKHGLQEAWASGEDHLKRFFRASVRKMRCTSFEQMLDNTQQRLLNKT